MIKNIYKNKNILNIHHADFDGVVSGLCCELAFGDAVQLIPSSISKVKQNIIKYMDDNTDIILLTDISLDVNDYDKFNDLFISNQLIIYDHHINNNLISFFDTLGTSKESILEEDFCGATITWMRLMEHFPDNEELPSLEPLVLLSDIYDMWRTDNDLFEYSVKFNDLLDYTIGYTPEQFRERLLKNPDPYKLSKKEKKIIEIKELRRKKSVDEMIENAVLLTMTDDDINVLFTEADNISSYGMYLCSNILNNECDENIDMFVFKYKNKPQASVRISENSKIEDLNVYTDILGCAGHAKAGGISTSMFYKFLEHIR